MAAPVLANRSVCFVNFVGTDDAGWNAVGAPQPRLTIGAALADLLANYPAATEISPHIVAVGPGQFATAAFELPPWTFIEGSCDGQGQPSTILNLSGNITLAAAWAANATTRGGIGGVMLRAASGTPIVDLTLPVPTAGNPARTLQLTNLRHNLTSVVFQATGNGDSLELDGVIEDGLLADVMAITGGTIRINQLQSVGTVTLASSATRALTALILASKIPAITVTKGAAACAVQFDGISWPLRAAVTLVGGPTLTRLSDANAEAYSPTTPGNWPVVPTTVQEALDELAGGGAAVPRQSGTTPLLIGTQSYVIAFPVVFAVAPTKVPAWTQLFTSTGEIFLASVDESTITTAGCTIWLNGVPSATAGRLVWEAF